MAKTRTAKLSRKGVNTSLPHGPYQVRTAEEFVRLFHATKAGGHNPHVRVIWPITGKAPHRHVLLAVYTDLDRCVVQYVAQTADAAITLAVTIEAKL